MSWVVEHYVNLFKIGLISYCDGFGILTGRAISGKRQNEDYWRNQFNYTNAGINQGIQVWAVFNRAIEVLKLAGSDKEIPSLVRWICVGTPIVLGLARQKLDPLTIEVDGKNFSILRYVRRVFCFIQDHIGTASQVAALVSYVAIGFFGQPLLGSFGAAWVVFGFFERGDFVPEKVSHTVSWLTALGVEIELALNLGWKDTIVNKALIHGLHNEPLPLWFNELAQSNC